MLSTVFGALGLGDLVAPRPDPLSELLSLIRSNQERLALEYLESVGEAIDIDTVDPRLGVNALHMSAATGSLKVLVELLSRGADVGILSTYASRDMSGSRALHFAAINDRKYIVEVLLRSGADPSLPNDAGQIPYELATDVHVKKLLLIEKTQILSKMLSPIALARRSQRENALDTDRSEKYSPNHIDGVPNGHGDGDHSGSSTERASSSTASVSMLNTSANAVSSEAEKKFKRPQMVPPLDLSKIVNKSSSIMRSRTSEHDAHVHDNAFSHSNESLVPAMSRISELEVTVSSERATAHSQSSVGETLSSRSDGDFLPFESSRSGIGSPVKPSQNTTFFNDRAMTPPPKRYEDSPMLTVDPRLSMQYETALPSINWNMQAMQVDSLTQKQVILQDEEKTLIPSKYAHSANSGANIERAQPYVSDMHLKVLQAAAETSSAYLEQDFAYEDRLFLFKACQALPKDDKQIAKSIERMTRMLERRPDLVCARLIDLGNLGKEGQTPLHVAAYNNNFTMLNILLNTYGASAWVRDLQGRTPLHCATESVSSDTENENQNYEVCKLLRAAMTAERPEEDPVGVHAPLDLAGRTPLGRQNRQKKGISPQPPALLQELLFRPGDKSVLPKSPYQIRSGLSPIKGATNHLYYESSENRAGQKNGIFDQDDREMDVDMYACSEGSGWKHYMEDRTLVACPFLPMRSWNLFAVCDGHAGTYCSQYLVDHMPRIISNVTASILEQDHSLQYQTPRPEELELILKEACAIAEHELAHSPRMEIELRATASELYDHTGQPKNAKALDSSGSTMVLCLVTPHHYAIANVGDCRALIAQYAAVEDTVRCAWATEDHKVSNDMERRRIEQAGLMVANRMCTLGSTSLNMTRSFGDFVFKQNMNVSAEQQAIIAVPDVATFVRSPADKFIVLACDGIFDVMSNQEVVSFFSSRICTLPTSADEDQDYEESPRPANIAARQAAAAAACDELLQECLKRGSCDNMSVVVVLLGSPVPL